MDLVLSAMKNSFLSSQFRRAGDTLRKGASDQIADYTKRFDSVKDIYDIFLHDLIRKNFSSKDAVETAKTFFGSNRVGFAAVDGTEYTQPLFDLVIFYGASYAARGFVEFTDVGPKVEYSTKFAEEGVGISSCVPMYVNEIVDVDQSYGGLEGGNLNVNKSLTDEEVINNSTIANWIMTFSEFYLAYKLAKQGESKILLLDRSLCTMHGSLIYDTRLKKSWNGALLGFEVDGVKVDVNDLAYNRHRLVNPLLQLPPPRGDYLRYALIYLLDVKGSLTFDEICESLGIDSADRRRRVNRFLARSVTEGYLQKNGEKFEVAPPYIDSWSRIKRLVETIGSQLFDGVSSENPMQFVKDGKHCWLTTVDLSFLSLYCFYMLIEECWSKNILLLGITKDTTARDFKTHLIPVCQIENIWNCHFSQQDLDKTPNTDRMLLQYMSVNNFEEVAYALEFS